ncbi:hypothetical protein [Micromonospora sp. KC721]|uniref:hypothetical protein n=1 Tax=Micromonospora sp. KC721 TaxID=2530380 RepID=UPI001404B31D|nr:hypothetical protein [Micromonospora sp. KC721]
MIADVTELDSYIFLPYAGLALGAVMAQATKTVMQPAPPPASAHRVMRYAFATP